MAKGKYGERAEVRKEIQSRDSEIETYRNAVKRLTAERDAAKEQLEASRIEHARVARVLRARLEQVTSPQVEALNMRIAGLQNDLDEALRISSSNMKRLGKLMIRLQEHLIEVHGRKQQGAFEEALIWSGGVADENGRVWDPETHPIANGTPIRAGHLPSDERTPNRIRTLEKLRGLR